MACIFGNAMPYILFVVSNNPSVKGMNVSFRSTFSMQFAYIVDNFIFLTGEVLLNTIAVCKRYGIIAFCDKGV